MQVSRGGGTGGGALAPSYFCSTASATKHYAVTLRTYHKPGKVCINFKHDSVLEFVNQISSCYQCQSESCIPVNIVTHIHYSLVNNVPPLPPPQEILYPHSYQWMLYPIQYSLVNTVPHTIFTSEYCISYKIH